MLWPERSLPQDSLRKYQGKTLAEVAKLRGKSPEETAIDLVVQDGSRVEVAYFLMNEDNVKKQVALPWLSFGSDEGSYTNEGIFLKSNAHPRAYGNFARVLGKYSRDEKLISLQEAIRKLSNLPAKNLKIQKNQGLISILSINLTSPQKAAMQHTAPFTQWLLNFCKL